MIYKYCLAFFDPCKLLFLKIKIEFDHLLRIKNNVHLKSLLKHVCQTTI